MKKIGRSSLSQSPMGKSVFHKGLHISEKNVPKDMQIVEAYNKKYAIPKNHIIVLTNSRIPEEYKSYFRKKAERIIHGKTSVAASVEAMNQLSKDNIRQLEWREKFIRAYGKFIEHRVAWFDHGESANSTFFSIDKKTYLTGLNYLQSMVEDELDPNLLNPDTDLKILEAAGKL